MFPKINEQTLYKFINVDTSLHREFGKPHHYGKKTIVFKKN